MANIQSKRVWDDEQECWVRMQLSTRAIRLLNRYPLSQVKQRLGL